MKIFVMAILILGSILAHGNMDSGIDALDIIQNKTPCSQLSDDELEAIGEYYMEQMHPGQQHVMMDNMMGGEGSASLKQAHINMARNLYCGEQVEMPPLDISSTTSPLPQMGFPPIAFLLAGLVLGALTVFLLKR